LGKNEDNNLEKDARFVIDCFINESGTKLKIFSIDPIKPHHCLSLFSEDEIDELCDQAKSNL
jgi:hypothetical protein